MSFISFLECRFFFSYSFCFLFSDLNKQIIHFKKRYWRNSDMWRKLAKINLNPIELLSHHSIPLKKFQGKEAQYHGLAIQTNSIKGILKKCLGGKIKWKKSKPIKTIFFSKLVWQCFFLCSNPQYSSIRLMSILLEDYGLGPQDVLRVCLVNFFAFRWGHLYTGLEIWVL